MNESKVNALIDEQIAQLEKEKAEFQKKLDELKKIEADEAPKDAWPKDGDKYWYVSVSGRCASASWHYYGTDKRCMAIGNVFRTEEEAETALQRLKDLATVRADAKGFVPDWTDKKSKWFACCRHNPDGTILTFDCSTHIQNASLYFDSPSDVLDSINTHEAEWRRIFGVTEK